MIYAGILSGGIGARMKGAELPKQFLMLGEQPVLIHTIAPFLRNPRIDEVIIALPEAWVSHTEELIHQHYPGAERIRLIVGGETRNETLMRIVDDIEQRNGIHAEDAVISHDAVRPFVSDRIIDDNIDALREHRAVDTVIPAVDTIVESADGVTLCNIPLRSRMYQGQTPQSFYIQELCGIYTKLTAKEIAELTDAAKIFVLKGCPVGMVMGEPSNMKITTLYDLKIANALLTINV